MLGNHRLVAVTELRRIAKLRDGCLCTVHWTAVGLLLKLLVKICIRQILSKWLKSTSHKKGIALAKALSNRIFTMKLLVKYFGAVTPLWNAVVYTEDILAHFLYNTEDKYK